MTEPVASRSRPTAARRGSESRVGLYVWGAVVLAVVAVTILLGWHATGGTPDPTGTAVRMGSGAAVLNSGILVFREGLECILVLAAVTASMRGSNSSYRRPVAIGGGVGFAAAVGTWFGVLWFIGIFGGDGLTVQAATGIPAIVVLLVVMNWFFHKIYWTGWISHHNRRRKGVVASAGEVSARRTLLGLALLGFTSVYREGFEVVIFLQALRERFGTSVVLKGTSLGLLFTLAVGVLTFALHARLPYKRLLVITGGLLVLVLFVMVGEQVNEMQLAGWIGTTPISGWSVPAWAGPGSRCSRTGRPSYTGRSPPDTASACSPPDSTSPTFLLSYPDRKPGTEAHSGTWDRRRERTQALRAHARLSRAADRHQSSGQTKSPG